jgi:hemerythrin-like metal-binding protein
MLAVEWGEFLSIDKGGRIDMEHKVLFDIVNGISTPEQWHDEAHVKSVMHELLQYTIGHFHYEESVMEQCHWPEIADHVKRHSAFVETVTEMNDRVVRHWHPWYGSSIFVAASLWLVVHILDEDRRIGVFLDTGQIAPRTRRNTIPHVMQQVDQALATLRKQGLGKVG